MLLNTRKETPVKFNPGLSTNRPSNNWARCKINKLLKHCKYQLTKRCLEGEGFKVSKFLHGFLK